MTNTFPQQAPSPSGQALSARALALAGLALCEAAGRLHSWSLALLVVTFITALFVPLRSGAVFPLLAASLAAAGLQVFFAWRLAFDRQVFAAWARLQDEECLEAQSAFDSALGMLLRKNMPAGPSRSMADRVMGVRRLHLLQIAALLGQALTLLVLMGDLWWVADHA